MAVAKLTSMDSVTCLPTLEIPVVVTLSQLAFPKPSILTSLESSYSPKPLNLANLDSLVRSLLLDEPTSGLDSTTAMHLVVTLRQLALGGRAVVTTIHQPSSRLYQQLDKLLLLSEGHCMYYGEISSYLIGGPGSYSLS